MARPPDFMLHLREALAASWDKRTAYLEVEQTGNPALGQCYPTSRTVQHFYPETEIIKGKVLTGKSLDVHFWNGLRIDDDWYHIDLSWQQFPAGSTIQEFVVVERQELNDSEATKQRCALLLKRVDDYLDRRFRSS
jgi:ABC-type Fe3+/spermidine/putrescine transport system ATPase subunit